MPQAFCFRIAKLAGAILYRVSPGKKNALHKGFLFLFGSGYSRESVKITFINFALNAIDVFFYPSLTKAKTAGMVEYVGMDHIDNALKKGKGVILLHGHFGNEEFLMPAIGFAVNRRVNQLASRWEPSLNDSLANRFPNKVRSYAFKMRIKYRESLPIRFIYIDKGIRGAYEALRNNEILLLAADGREGLSWTEVNLLGRTALYSEGPMRIAMKTDAVVLPVFIVRKKDCSHRVIVEEPLALDRSGDKERDIRANTQKFIDRFLPYVNRYPCHFMKLFWLDMKYFKEFGA
jgi:KDO2-lipid IV(A) lauroyltransferase